MAEIAAHRLSRLRCASRSACSATATLLAMPPSATAAQRPSSAAACAPEHVAAHSSPDRDSRLDHPAEQHGIEELQAGHREIGEHEEHRDPAIGAEQPENAAIDPYETHWIIPAGGGSPVNRFGSRNRVEGVTNSSCAATVRISREPASAVRRSRPNDRGARRLHRRHRAAGTQPVEQEQRGDRVARAVDVERQQGRAQPVERAGLGRQQVDRNRPASPRSQAGQQHAARPLGRIRACSAATACLARASVAQPRPVSRPSSNWLGVAISAAAARDRA